MQEMPYVPNTAATPLPKEIEVHGLDGHHYTVKQAEAAVLNRKMRREQARQESVRQRAWQSRQRGGR